jgi:hypothetical protein
MSDTTRRDLARLVAGGAVAVAAVAATTTQASAYQGNMERAVSALYSALSDLREATPNKGGHRENAMQLIQQAIQETEAGIEWADEH